MTRILRTWQSYDHMKGAWDLAKKAFNLPISGGQESDHALPGPAANETNANQNNDGDGADAENAKGEGRIVINGEPRATGGCKVILKGARPGVAPRGTPLDAGPDGGCNRRAGSREGMAVRTLDIQGPGPYSLPDERWSFQTTGLNPGRPGLAVKVIDILGNDTTKTVKVKVA